MGIHADQTNDQGASIKAVCIIKLRTLDFTKLIGIYILITVSSELTGDREQAAR